MASLKFIFMDAGQGDSTLVVYPDNSLMLIDCGSMKSGSVVMSEIVEVLRKHLPSTNRIKTLVLTHPDADHYNMLGAVTTELKIQYDQVIFGGVEKEYKAPVGGAGGLLSTIPHVPHICLQNDIGDPQGTPNPALTRSGVNGWVLAANHPYTSYTPANNKSVVLLLEYQGVKVFLMGDSESKAEDAILKRYATDTLLDPPSGGRVVLKLGHHGSKTSSSAAWIQKIKPQVLFISADLHRGHKHPALTHLQAIAKNTKLHQVNSNVYIAYDQAAGDFAKQTDSNAIYTTMYEYNPKDNPPSSVGGSYYYTINDNGSVNISRTD